MRKALTRLLALVLSNPVVAVLALAVAATHHSGYAWFVAITAGVAAVGGSSRGEGDGPRYAIGPLAPLNTAVVVAFAVDLLIYLTGPYTHHRHDVLYAVFLGLGGALVAIPAVDRLQRLRLQRLGRWPAGAIPEPRIAARLAFIRTGSDRVGALIRWIARGSVRLLARIPFPTRQLHAVSARLTRTRDRIPLPRSRPDEAYLMTLRRARRGRNTNGLPR